MLGTGENLFVSNQVVVPPERARGWSVNEIPPMFREGWAPIMNQIGDKFPDLVALPGQTQNQLAEPRWMSVTETAGAIKRIRVARGFPVPGCLQDILTGADTCTMTVKDRSSGKGDGKRLTDAVVITAKRIFPKREGDEAGTGERAEETTIEITYNDESGEIDTVSFGRVDRAANGDTAERIMTIDGRRWEVVDENIIDRDMGIGTALWAKQTKKGSVLLTGRPEKDARQLNFPKRERASIGHRLHFNDISKPPITEPGDVSHWEYVNLEAVRELETEDVELDESAGERVWWGNSGAKVITNKRKDAQSRLPSLFPPDTNGMSAAFMLIDKLKTPGKS